MKNGSSLLLSQFTHHLQHANPLAFDQIIFIHMHAGTIPLASQDKLVQVQAKYAWYQLHGSNCQVQYSQSSIFLLLHALSTVTLLLRRLGAAFYVLTLLFPVWSL